MGGAECRVGDHAGLAGHVLLSYPSGGQLLASASHWSELSRLDVTEATLLEVAASYGTSFHTKVQASLAACPSPAHRRETIQTYSNHIVQQSVPCMYSTRQRHHTT